VVKDSGLSPAQMHNIEVIGHHRNMMMRELAERLGITTGTLTVAVDRLEKLGMIARGPDKHDRRAWLVVLTARGRSKYEKHNGFREEFTREICHDLSGQEAKHLAQLMERVLLRMQNGFIRRKEKT
jgi:DNA-binding MarR family transcriptional regulator